MRHDLLSRPRRLALVAGGAALGLAAVAGIGGPVAGAGCPGNDGTLQGSPSRAHRVAVGTHVYYVDDRDYLDLDRDGDAGGIWIYAESNGVGGLQRGGNQYVFANLDANGVPTSLPYLKPLDTPAGRLFPNGFGGSSLAEAAGSHDDCVQSTDADSIIF